MKSFAINKSAAFRCLNTSLELLHQGYKMVETARLLYPEIDPKYFDKIYKMSHQISVYCPMHTKDWEF
jgi:hypothetical protein